MCAPKAIIQVGTSSKEKLSVILKTKCTGITTSKYSLSRSYLFTVLITNLYTRAKGLPLKQMICT